MTTPKAMAEVFVHRSYETQKTDIVRISLARIIGNGLLMAEEDEHKVSSFTVDPLHPGCDSPANPRLNVKTSCQHFHTVMLRISTIYSGQKVRRW